MLTAAERCKRLSARFRTTVILRRAMNPRRMREITLLASSSSALRRLARSCARSLAARLFASSPLTLVWIFRAQRHWSSRNVCCAFLRRLKLFQLRCSVRAAASLLCSASIRSRSRRIRHRLPRTIA
eukprot:scaffold2679_cov251-Pinguiococcus_pyrenoidosus.AAC.8